MLKLFSDSFLSFAFACISERNISVDSLARHSLMPSLFISSFPLSVSFSFFSSFLLFHYCFFPFHFIVYIFFLLNISFSSFSVCLSVLWFLSSGLYFFGFLFLFLTSPLFYFQFIVISILLFFNNVIIIYALPMKQKMLCTYVESLLVFSACITIFASWYIVRQPSV